MEQLKAWILQLVVIGLGGVIAGSLIHRESFQRYLKLIVGFLMIMVLIQPVIRLSDSTFDPAALLGAEPLAMDTDAAAGNIRRVNEDWISDFALEDMQSQIETDIGIGLGITCRADVTLTEGGGGIGRVRISASRPLLEDERQWILARMRKDYGLGEDQVRIVGG